MTGRPSEYNDEIAARICEWIADGKSLRSFCEQEGTPSKSTICLWIVSKEDFSDQYVRAREAAGYAHADDILHTADETRTGLLEPNVAKVVIDAKKWAAERMAPKRHSPRQEVTGAEGGAVQIEGVEVTFVRPQVRPTDG